MLRAVERFVALLAPPEPARFDNLLVASLRAARRVVKAIALDVSDGSSCKESAGLVRESVLRLLDLLEGLHLGGFEARCRYGTSTRIGVGSKVDMLSTRIIPASQVETFLYVRVDLHGTCADHAEGTS